MIAIDHTRGNAVSLRWLLYDGHGNLVRTLSPNYTLSAFQWRGVWGEVQGSLGTGRGYCANLGHPEDETGLVYMRARYYEPATGRFVSEDPARDGVNWYLYADGNPVNKVDVSGSTAEEEFYKLIGTSRTVAVLGMLIVGILKLLNLKAGGRMGAFIDHLLESLTTMISVVEQFRRLAKAAIVGSALRGDVARKAANLLAAQLAVSSVMTLYALQQVRLAYLALADPTEYEDSENQWLFGLD